MLRFIIAIVILLASTNCVVAVIWYVPSQCPTIQAGILSSGDYDTIMVQSGVYCENIDFLGHKVVLASQYLFTNDSSYIENTIIDGNSAGSVVSFHNREDSTTIICGFTITNGLNDAGGGIYCLNSSPVIEYNIITGNTGNSGGGIYCNNSSAKIIGNLISDNTIYSPLGNPGGGIFCNNGSNCLIMENIITGNINQDGAGICCYSSNPLVIRNTIHNNDALDLGGGFRIDNCSPVIINNTIWGNSASSGGGLCINSNSNPVLTNNIIWNNSATIGQNEIQLNGGAPQITYSDVQGGWPGNGNIDLNPLMVDPNHNCFQLQPSSPCIDAGDPISPLDPDGTIVDMGAFYFDQFILNIDSLNISYEGNDIILHWDAVPQAVVYHIYRSDEPYFDITVMNPLASTTETSYIDEDALNEEKYYYRVTWE